MDKREYPIEYVEDLEKLANAAFEVVGGFAVTDHSGNEIISARAMRRLRLAAQAFHPRRPTPHAGDLRGAQSVQAGQSLEGETNSGESHPNRANA